MRRFSAFTLAALAGFLMTTGARAQSNTYDVTVSKIDDTNDGHGTTRTTVRHVFREAGTWYVFSGDHQGGSPGTYYSFFVTSDDGIHWSGRKVGTGGGVVGGQYGAENIPETPIVYGDTIYGAFLDSANNDLVIRTGTLANADISWSAPSVVAAGSLNPRETFGYYPDIMINEDGRLSLTARHYYLDASDNPHLDPVTIVSTHVGDITSWQTPQGLTTLTSPEMTDGHENVPLPGGKRVIVVRTHNGVYEPGTPGNFLAFHWSGAQWTGPVDLGDSDGINGSDRRHAAMLDPGSGVVHLLYIEDSGTMWDHQLRYRSLSPPYGTSDWSAPTVLDTNVFTVAMGMDTSVNPARVVAVYGDQKQTGSPPWESRLHTGELFIRWFDGAAWEANRQLFSEPGTEYNWYPSVSQDASGTFGILYQKGHWDQGYWELMFALVEPDVSSQTPAAQFEASPVAGEAPLEVVFTDLSTDPDGSVVSWLWDFGDGHSATDHNPVHTYTAPGVYTVTLTVTDDQGNQDTETKPDFVTVYDLPFQEIDGRVVVEAEHFDLGHDRGGHAWAYGNSLAGFCSDGYMTALPNQGASTGNSGFESTTAEIAFRVDFTSTGIYHLWVRGFAASADDDSCHLGLDGAAQPASTLVSWFSSYGAWEWIHLAEGEQPAALTVASAGVHTVHLWMREDGLSVDKIVLERDAGFVPQGCGPGESPRECTPDCTGRECGSDGCGGSCGACSSPYQCNPQGSCACPPGTDPCQGSCVDLASDPDNCGSCGSACAAGESCVAGGCQSGCPDADGDGHQAATCGGDDCDDADAGVHPGAQETCDGQDGDCDGFSDEDYSTLGAGCTAGLGACEATGSMVCSADGTDVVCDAVPGAPAEEEDCDGVVDDDCDGTVDNGCPCTDGDQRSCYGGPAGTEEVGVCRAGTQTCSQGAWGDCLDQVLPADEACDDGADNDCDGQADDADTDCGACPDVDGDGHASAACGGDDCNDSVYDIHPGAGTVCGDGVDQDCDGQDEACDDVNGSCGCGSRDGGAGGGPFSLLMLGMVLWLTGRSRKGRC